MTPAPAPVVIAVLRDLAAVSSETDRVSTQLLSPLPALRVVKVGDAEPPSGPAIAPLFQSRLHLGVGAFFAFYALCRRRLSRGSPWPRLPTDGRETR